MTTVTHATAATGTDSGDGKISKNAWNEAHTVTESGALFGSSAPDGGDQGWFYFQQNGQGGGALWINVGSLATPDWGKVSSIGNLSGTAAVSVADGAVGARVVSLIGNAVSVNAGPAPMGAEIMSGSADPSAGAGVLAPPPALYLRGAPGDVGELWLKVGTSDTQWTKIL